MARIWSERQLERVTPPQAKDVRGAGFIAALNRFFGERPLPGPPMRDPATCSSDVLPALVAEYSMEEFIEPGLPEHVVRRILQNRWALQTGEGYDAGVKLGLGLLGMSVVIEHWWQAEPKRAPNTHDLIFYIGEQLFANDQAFFGEREKKAAFRMIEATKRWSQESTIYVGVSMRPPKLRTAQHVRGLSFRKARMRVIQHPPRLPLALGQTARFRATTVHRSRMRVGQQSPVSQLQLSASQTSRALSLKRLRLGPNNEV
jgi:phage tail P2-like protein